MNDDILCIVLHITKILTIESKIETMKMSLFHKFIATPATIPPTSIIGTDGLHARLSVEVVEIAPAAEVVAAVGVVSVVDGTSPVEV